MATKMTAPRSGWPTLAMALLIAETSPEYRGGTEPMRVFVSGATMHAMPRPNRRTAGTTSMKTSGGGIKVTGSATDAFHGAESTGRRVSQSNPLATTRGPPTRKRRTPTPPAHAPIRRGGRGRPRARRRAARPRRGRGIAQHVLVQDPLVAEGDVQAAVDEERGEVD